MRHAWSQAVPTKKILYVTRLNLPTEADARQKDIHQKGLASDQDVRRHLEARGFQVTLIDQAAPPGKAQGFDLVIISSVVRSLDMAETAYKDLPVPLLTWENDLFDSLRLTGRRKGIDYDEVEKEHYIRVVNAPHPLAAGLPSGKTYIYTRDLPVGWGTPARSAIVIATLSGDPDKAVVFGYEKGATMDHDLSAPARRVAFFLDNTTFGQLSPHGLRLFDASVDWALAPAAKAPPTSLDR